MKATIIFTDHADFDTPEMLKAICYGTSDENSPVYGKKGFIGNGLRFTKSVFAKPKEPFSPEKIESLRKRMYGKIPSIENRENWQIMNEERRLSQLTYGLQNKEFYKLIVELSKKGIEICPHCLSWESSVRKESEELFKYFKEFKCKTWIDHGEKYCFNSLSSKGKNSESEYYILDLLHKYQYKFAWAYHDVDFYGNLTISKKSPTYFDKQLKLLMFKTMLIKASDYKIAQVYSPRFIDKLIKDKGHHISHTYFFQPIFKIPKRKLHFRGERYWWYLKSLFKKYKPRKEISNGYIMWDGDNWVIEESFNKCLEYMKKKQDEGLLNVTTIKDYLEKACH